MSLTSNSTSKDPLQRYDIAFQEIAWWSANFRWLFVETEKKESTVGDCESNPEENFSSQLKWFIGCSGNSPWNSHVI